MDKPIAVGDLVQVVKACCRKTVLTPVFVVDRMWNPGAGSECAFCRTNFPIETTAVHAFKPNNHAYPLSWLKRIPPLSELEGVKSEETLRLPKKETA